MACCKVQYNNTKEMEKYDFETINKYPATINPIGIIRNGWEIMMSRMTITGAFYKEYPPVPEFYAVGKTFYPRGTIKSKIYYTGERLRFGESIYYDEDGKIINRVNEDAKFGKIKVDDLLLFIEKEGWINLETGEGREDIDILEDGRCDYIPSHFYISEEKVTDGTSYWLITIPAMRYNDFIRTTYHIDKETGEVLYKNAEIIIYRK